MHRPTTLIVSLLACAAMLSTSLPVTANPFTLSEGATQLTFTATFFSTDEYLDGFGDDFQLPYDLEQTSFILGFEHGISDTLTITASLPWSSAERGVVGDDDGTLATNDGISDARLGLKWRLNEGATVWSLLAGAKWPGEYEADVINSPGDGNFDLELGVGVGRQFRKVTVSLDALYRSRSGNPDDEIAFRLESSYLINARFLLFGSIDYIDSQGGINTPPNPGIFLPYSLAEEDLTQIGLGGLVSFSEKVSAYAAVLSTIDGTNTALGNQFGFGLSFSF